MRQKKYKVNSRVHKNKYRKWQRIKPKSAAVLKGIAALFVSTKELLITVQSSNSNGIFHSNFLVYRQSCDFLFMRMIDKHCSHYQQDSFEDLPDKTTVLQERKQRGFQPFFICKKRPFYYARYP